MHRVFVIYFVNRLIDDVQKYEKRTETGRSILVLFPVHFGPFLSPFSPFLGPFGLFSAFWAFIVMRVCGKMFTFVSS